MRKGRISISISRKDLVDAAKRSDICLRFGDGLKLCNCSAKKFWRLGAEKPKEFNLIHLVTEDVGAGAIFEMSRILTTFTMIFGRILTFNPSTVIGGTSINFDEMQSKGTHLVKTTSCS
jgi:glutamate carboxypeptidase